MIRDGALDRAVLLPIVALGLFLFAAALALGKPGLPTSLRADEAAHLLQMSSLVADGDLRIDAHDIERLFTAYPYGGAIEVPLTWRGDGALTVDRPAAYAVISTPWFALLGPNGPLAMNVLLATLGMLLLALYFHRSGNAPSVSGTVAVAAVALSALFPYFFWYHPALLWLALGALIAVDHRSAAGQALAGGALGLLALWLPTTLAVWPALAMRQVTARRWRPWLAGVFGGLAIAATLAVATGSTLWGSSGSGDSTAVVRLADPSSFDADAVRSGALDLRAARDATRLKPAAAVEFGERLVNATVERRRGLLPYFPLVLLGLIGAFAAVRRLEPWRLALLGGLVMDLGLRAGATDAGLGGGLLADPSQAALYPLFFVLAPTLPAPPIRLAILALATLLLGSALVSALGPSMAFGDPQAHTRGGLLASMPLVRSHIGLAGVYSPMELGGDPALDAKLWWPSYAGERNGDELWLLGGEHAELFLDTARPLDEPSLWRLRNIAPSNVVRLRFPGYKERLAFPDELPPGGQGADLEWTAGDGERIAGADGDRYLYPIKIHPRRGWKPAWQGGEAKTFYLGAALTFLGPQSHLGRDVFNASALGCGAPPTVTAGETFEALVRFGNESPEIWNDSGAARVRISHRWLRDDGAAPVEGPRTDVGAPVAPGTELASWVTATAPAAPGDYHLAVDLVYENVAYFADRTGAGPLCAVPVRVAPPRPAADAN
ncbi:MAG: hypothetical protein AAGM22_03360 [Acidobacteriota bacterium]